MYKVERKKLEIPDMSGIAGPLQLGHFRSFPKFQLSAYKGGSSVLSQIIEATQAHGKIIFV